MMEARRAYYFVHPLVIGVAQSKLGCTVVGPIYVRDRQHSILIPIQKHEFLSANGGGEELNRPTSFTLRPKADIRASDDKQLWLPLLVPRVPGQETAGELCDRTMGLTAGFLNAVESRLRETELALFYALSELHDGTIERRTYAGLSDFAVGLSSHLSKSDMMEKWANLPLGDRIQTEA
ncbi:hypothetical protein CHU98_g2717 [Xylaria longipes]|nr:hypothetical protein CHU98_g2717 [Xylaria longipes]